MTKIANLTPEITTWKDALQLPAYDPSDPSNPDPKIDLETIRTATAEFEGKTLGANCAVGTDTDSVRIKATRVRRSIATPAAAGSDQAGATALTVDQNNVTGADGTKGVALPAAVAGDEVVIVNTSASAALKVYPVNGGAAAINGLSANAAYLVLPGERCVFVAESATQWRMHGLRVARGQHTTVDEDDTVVTGLNQVVSVVAQLDSDPVDGAMHVTSTIGDQAGAPDAGSIQIKTWKSTDGDATLAAASTFSMKVNWIAVGY